MLAPVIAGWIYNWRPVVLYPISAGVLIFSMMLSYLMMRRSSTERVENQVLDSIDVEMVDEA
jgi:hypothetical protein